MTMETDVVYEAFLKFFSDQVDYTMKERYKEQLKQQEERMEQQKEQMEKQKAEARLITISTVFENGGTDETAKKYLNATEEEVKMAHQYLEKKKLEKIEKERQ